MLNDLSTRMLESRLMLNDLSIRTLLITFLEDELVKAFLF